MQKNSTTPQEPGEDAPNAMVWATPIVTGMVLGCVALYVLHWRRGFVPDNQWLLHFLDGFYRGIVYGIGFAIGVMFAFKVMQSIADWRELRELRLQANARSLN